MAAYVIVDTKIKNTEAYEGYKAQAAPIAAKYGGRYLARGGAIDLHDTMLWTPTRVVVVEFPSRQAANEFLNSAEYQPVKELRLANADCTTFVLDGM